MRKQNEQMPVRYKCLDGGEGSDFYFERSLDLIFSPGAFLVEIDHTDVKVGLPTEFCGGEHYIVGTLVVTDSGNTGATQKDRITGQVLMFTDRESADTKLYARTYASGAWSEWRSLAFVGMYDKIATTDELLATVNTLVNESKENTSCIVSLEAENLENSAQNSFTIVGVTDSTILSYHSFFRNVRIEYVVGVANIDYSSVALSLIRKGFTEGKAEIRWSASIDGERKYITELIDFSVINPYGYTHIEQENSALGIKISYDVDLKNPDFPRTKVIFSLDTIPTVVVSQNHIVGIVNDSTESFNHLFVENKDYYIKIKKDISLAELTPVYLSNSRYAIVDVVEGQNFTITAKGSDYVAAWAVIDFYGKVIECSDFSSNEVSVQKIIPENAAKLIVNYLGAGSPSLVLHISSLDDITELYRKSAELKQTIEKVDFFKFKDKKILCLGDSITEFKDADGLRYSDYIAMKTGAVVYNGGIGASHMEQRAELVDVPSSVNAARAALDLPAIVNALVTGEWSYQDAAVEFLSADGDDNSKIIAELKSVDLSEIDIVTIFIGTNDKDTVLGEIGDTTAVGNSLGGLYTAISKLLTANPNIRVYYFSPMVRYFGNLNEEWDTTQWCDNYAGANDVAFPDMVDKFIKGAEYWKIPVCDMYRTLGVNQFNIKSIMRENGTDGTHPYRGFKMIANRMISFITANNNLNV